MKTPPNRKAEARFKQLCSLGLDSQVLMPALLEALRELMPFSQANFFWSDDSFEASNVYSEGPMDNTIIEIYLSKFHNWREKEVHLSFTEMMHLSPGVYPGERLLKVSRREFYRHDYFNLILRPFAFDFFDAIFVPVRDPSRPVGILAMFRAKGDPQFKAQEERLLERLTSFLTHALSATVPYTGPWVESEDAALVILNCGGEIQHLSPEAQRLLYYCGHPEVLPRAVRMPSVRDEISLLLKRLCQNLVGCFIGKEEAKPPVFHHQNLWGRFTFRAYWLDPSKQEGEALVGVTVQRQEPLPLKLLREMEPLPLSARERQVCLYIVQGDSYAEIARKLSRSERTIIAHTQHIYTKLNIRNRTELVNRLLLR